MRYKKDAKRGVSYLFIFPFFILLIIIVIIDAQMRPLIRKVAIYQSRIIATEIISRSVYNTLQSNDFSYNDLVTITNGADGYVTSIGTNMVMINTLEAKIIDSVNSELKTLSQETIKISTGTISGFELFYEKGPDLTFKLKPMGYVEVKLISKFSSAGINQTHHQIILEVCSTVSAVIPGYTTEAEVISNYIIAETVIVGKIPDSYTYISGDERDIISKINDYN